MMKEFLIIILSLIYTVVSFGQMVNDDNAFFDYSYDKSIIRRNKIETLKIDARFADGKYLTGKVYHFNEEGLLTKMFILDSSGKVKKEYLFVCNSHNDLAFRISKDYEYDTIDTVIYFRMYEGGKLIKDSVSYIPIGYSFEYAKNGKLYKTTLNANFGLDYQTKRVIVNGFDSIGRIVKVVETIYQDERDSIGKEVSNRDIFYNGLGKKEREVEKWNGEFSWMANGGSFTYVYDNVGNLLVRQRTNGASYIFTYNDKGLVTTKKMDLVLDDDFTDKVKTFQTVDMYIYSFRE